MIWVVSFIIAFLVLVALADLLGKKGHYKNSGHEDN
jgi:hypothetical protein